MESDTIPPTSLRAGAIAHRAWIVTPRTRFPVWAEYIDGKYAGRYMMPANDTWTADATSKVEFADPEFVPEYDDATDDDMVEDWSIWENAFNNEKGGT